MNTYLGHGPAGFFENKHMASVKWVGEACQQVVTTVLWNIYSEAVGKCV